MADPLDAEAHVARQLESARRLLSIVTAQAEAIRDQDVRAVLARVADVQHEMARRARLEAERDRLIAHTAARHGCAEADVTLETVISALPGDAAERVRTTAAELRRVLEQVGRIHAQNRALITQELRFLDQLMRALTVQPEGGYRPTGAAAAAPPQSLVDARA